MKTWIYSWCIYPLVFTLARVWGIFSKKVRDTLRLRAWINYLSLRTNSKKKIRFWIHVASSGELEYAIPLIEQMEKKDELVLITYYSISAKNPVEALSKKYKNVSLTAPLPHDGVGLMRAFVNLVHSQGVRAILLMKYELWPGMLWECNKQGIKVVLVDALKPSWFHQRLLHKLFCILSGYASEIDGVVHPRVEVFGDTRVERVLDRVRAAPNILPQKLSLDFKKLAQLPNLFVLGSMWPTDDRLLLAALTELPELTCNLIWVPHELCENQSQHMQGELKKLNFQVHSIEDFNEAVTSLRSAYFVQKKGVLAELYTVAQAAMVGGGFQSGVHSVWEPALAGCEVVCGPRIDRSPESTLLKNAGLLTVVHTPDDLKSWILTRLNPKHNEAYSNERSLKIEQISAQHQGAAKRVVDYCLKEIK